MIYRSIPRLVFIVLGLLVLLSMAFAFAANIVVPPTRLTDQARAVTASELAPAECDSIRSLLTTVVVCTGGNCNGSNASELIVGTTGNDDISGKNGNDCIVGGGGDDILNGGNHDDVLVGADGNDTLDGGRPTDTDTCYGGAGANTFIECDLTP
jgi:Ca2+-binding RTX toxin-like protein